MAKNLSPNQDTALARLREADKERPGSWHSPYELSNAGIPTLKALVSRGLAERTSKGGHGALFFPRSCTFYRLAQGKAGTYFDSKGTLRNLDGSRSIFDDVDE